MDGYLKNKTNDWKHAFKKQVRPGGKVPLDDLYTLYGEKNNLKQGKDFVDWLIKVKLSKSLNQWEIILKKDFVEDSEALTVSLKEEETKENNSRETVEQVTSKSIRKYSVEDVIKLSYRKAQKVLPSIVDLNLLKYAYKEANQLSGKSSLSRLLDKRVKELEIGR